MMNKSRLFTVGATEMAVCVTACRIVNDNDVPEERVAFVLRMTELGSGRHRITLSMKAALRYLFTILHVVVRTQKPVI